MTLPDAALAHYRDQQVIAGKVTGYAADVWRSMGPDYDLSYADVGPELFSAVTEAQGFAAANGLAYVPAVLDQQGIDPTLTATINPLRMQGGTDDGRPLESLLHGAVYKSKQAVGTGATWQQGLAVGGSWLTSAVLDAVRDADRQAVQATLSTTKVHTVWVRMLNPPSCRFCIMLAGKVYRWNQGFPAHKHCDCRHIPTQESEASDVRVDPYAYFRSLGGREQDRLFGKTDAQAIRDGADIYRVGNTRMRGVTPAPRTDRMGWQSRRWGTPNVTVDELYALAGGSRAKAVQLLEQNGYIIGPQTPGGDLIGNNPGGLFGDLAAGQAGRGGTRKGATAAYRQAVATGKRDPLEPATQTAAERRLHVAVLRKQRMDAGANPFMTGRPVSVAQRELVQREYDRQLRRARSEPNSQVGQLARLLGII